LNQLLHPEILKILHEVWYRFRFFALYIIIGIFSLLLEVVVRSQLLSTGLHMYLATSCSLTLGILFAFFGNTYFNFQIPPARRNRALIFFFAISLFSGATQWGISQIVDLNALSYEKGRFLISGSFFIIAYLLHRRFSFQDLKRVGVAIYANGVENLNSIHERIGQYPNFIHVDIVDKTFASDTEKIKAYRMETIRAFWPNREIHTHIMSRTPSKWISEVLPYSDLIYVHWECDEPIEHVLQSIRSENVRTGIAFTMKTDPSEAQSVLPQVDSILLLTISQPGQSGQEFDATGLERIQQLNKAAYRNQLRICIDGGVDEKIAPLLQVEDVVSGSSVLNHEDPKLQIMRLQTAGRYELL